MRFHKSCSGVVKSLLLRTYFVSCIFTKIIKILISHSILVWGPQSVRPSDMLQPSMQTLKHIVVDIHIDHIDDLFSIRSEFEVMGTKNIIETVTIIILLNVGANCWSGDSLGRLDEVLTILGWFSLK